MLRCVRGDDPTPYARQDADGLLTQADLPEGWFLPTRFPGERSGDDSAQFDKLLGYDDSWAGRNPEAAARVVTPAPPDVEYNQPADGRWRYIEHTATGTRVYIRLQRQVFAVPEEVRITGIVHLPGVPGEAITSKILRELPTALIEQAVNQRLFAMTTATTITGNQKITLPSGAKVARRELLKPLTGTGKTNKDFYHLVALQQGELVRQGDKNPSATMAKINDAPLTTVQGWVAKARHKGLLPPGRRGRAG